MNGNELESEEPEKSGNVLDDDSNHGDQIVEPKLGMMFESADELFEFYNNYAYKTGFFIKKRTCKKENGVLVHVSYACSKEGKNITASNTPLNLLPTQRTGCKAKISARLCADDKWMISVVSLQHNHLNSPSKARYLRGHKRINTATKKRVLSSDKAGIRMCKIYGALTVEGGGYENLSYDEKTLRNMIAREKVLELGEGDATALLDHFTNMQNKDPNFFYRLDIDGIGRLKNVFWADNRCRESYKEFGEVVTFDTTYLTNKYDMPFSQFVGVNHHGQSILLGCGLLSNEEKETFAWLFKAWLDCMNGVAPGGIITDQASAMKIAIEIVFKDTKHRWCLWHIMKKIPEKLRRYDNYVRIKSRMKKVVYDSQCPAEFEERWSEMLEKYESLKQNKWLSKLYREKDRWIPCFVKTTFWAGMSTTQRSVSMNHLSTGMFIQEHL
ncbi:hypothetical protein MKW98_031619 [Papaver atlanticum]|uniref:Protein FAR1-RELATED SEQUENCE n=1 Tax=Papaver atlanticum TaxID=357466 RepID=A0AAD4S5E5_9MAGN|nr:hypothetical protein MKW98_031619 [Papaver atlanticum]